MNSTIIINIFPFEVSIDSILLHIPVFIAALCLGIFLDSLYTEPDLLYIRRPWEKTVNKKLICNCVNCQDSTYPIYKSSSKCAQCGITIPCPTEKNGIYNFKSDNIFRTGHPLTYSWKDDILYYFDMCGECSNIILSTPVIEYYYNKYYLRSPFLICQSSSETLILANNYFLYYYSIPYYVLRACILDYLILYLLDVNRETKMNSRKWRAKFINEGKFGDDESDEGKFGNDESDEGKFGNDESDEGKFGNDESDESKFGNDESKFKINSIEIIVSLMACNYLSFNDYDNNGDSYEVQNVLIDSIDKLISNIKYYVDESEIEATTEQLKNYGWPVISFLTDLASMLQKRVDNNRRDISFIFTSHLPLDIENVILDYVDRTFMFLRQCRQLLLK